MKQDTQKARGVLMASHAISGTRTTDNASSLLRTLSSDSLFPNLHPFS
jgi:hypothetical protein